jgi:hypothetical protein
MFYAYVQRFNPTKNLENFYKILGTKRPQCDTKKNFLTSPDSRSGRRRRVGRRPWMNKLETRGEGVNSGAESVCITRWSSAAVTSRGHGGRRRQHY